MCEVASVPFFDRDFVTAYPRVVMRSPIAATLLLLLMTLDRPCHPPVVAFGADTDIDSASSSSIIIGGYLPDYRDYVDVNSTAVYLTDMMLFSLTPSTILQEYSDPPKIGEDETRDGDRRGGGGGCCLSSRHYDTMRRARSYEREERRRRRRGRATRIATIADVDYDEDEDNENDIRILVTIGGGGRSDGFRDVVLGEEGYINRFVMGMVRLW